MSMGSVVFLFTCIGKHGDDLPHTSCGVYIDVFYPRCVKMPRGGRTYERWDSVRDD